MQFYWHTCTSTHTRSALKFVYISEGTLYLGGWSWLKSQGCDYERFRFQLQSLNSPFYIFKLLFSTMVVKHPFSPFITQLHPFILSFKLPSTPATFSISFLTQKKTLHFRHQFKLYPAVSDAALNNSTKIGFFGKQVFMSFDTQFQSP